MRNVPRLPRISCIFWLTALLLVSALHGCATNKSAGTQTELQTISDQTDDQKRAEIRLQLAIGYYEQRQLAVALDEIKQALQADPDFASAYGMRGLIYMEMGEMPLAEDNFLRAIKIAPNNPDLSNNYAWFLCQNGRESQSISYFEAAFNNRSYQSPAKALHNAGVCSLKANNLVAAEKYFMLAFRLEPGNLSTSFQLARIFYDRADLERARFYIDRVTKTEQSETVPANILWLAIKIEHKLDDRVKKSSLAARLRRHHAGSPEYSAYQRGKFDE